MASFDVPEQGGPGLWPPIEPVTGNGNYVGVDTWYDTGIVPEHSAPADVFLHDIEWPSDLVVTTEQAAEVLEPLAACLFTPREHRLIEWADMSRNRDKIDPPCGPAIGALFHEHVPNTMRSALDKPADLVIAQKTNDSGLITVEWHTVKQLTPPIDACGEGNCVRLLYHGEAEVETQNIDGSPVELSDQSMALSGLRWALINLDQSGVGYDISPDNLKTNRLAQEVVHAGHQLTIPDAVAVSHRYGFPYTAK